MTVYYSLEQALGCKQVLLEEEEEEEMTYRRRVCRNTSGSLYKYCSVTAAIASHRHAPGLLPNPERSRSCTLHLRPSTFFTATQTSHAHPHTPPFSDWTSTRKASRGSRAFDACLQTGTERNGERAETRGVPSMDFRFWSQIPFFIFPSQ